MQNFDVWAYDPEQGINIWLGYVNHEYVEDAGYMYQAYRAREFGLTASTVFGVISLGAPTDDAEKAQQLIEDHFGVSNW